MNTVKKILYYTLLVMSLGLILLTLLSFIYNVKLWYYKILDFPRIQYLLLGILFLVLFVTLTKKWKLPSFLLLVSLLAVIVIHGMVIYPYLYGQKTVLDFQDRSIKTEDAFSIILANVLVDNRQSKAFLDIVKEHDPDILLAMEVDEWWIKELQVLEEKYPYKLEFPLDNAYGMSMYSKLPMDNTEIKFLNKQDVPSFHTIMTLPSGKTFNFHGIHPVAPVPSKKYPDNVGEKEVALLKIGKIVSKNSLPSIVAGDFNDVSWSRTSRMFGEEGKLNNVRIGRGLYNTFDATSYFFRWPLDHYFVTREFKVVHLERLPKFGSDHFPFYGRFVLEP